MTAGDPEAETKTERGSAGAAGTADDSHSRSVQVT